MKSRLFRQIFLSHLIIIILFSIFFPFFIMKAVKKHHVDNYAESLRQMALAMEEEISVRYQRGGFKELDSYVKGMKNRLHVRITVIKRDGVVVADSESDPTKMENHTSRPEVMEALSGNFGRSLRWSSTISQEMLYVAVPLKKENDVYGALRISAYISTINEVLEDVKRKVFLLSVLFILLSFVFSIYFSKGLSKTIREIIDMASSIANGNFKKRLFLKNKGEFSELADIFNNMAYKIDSLFNEVAERNEELRTILSSIREFIVLLDREDRIKMSNDSFKAFSGVNRDEGRYHYEVVRSFELVALIEKAKKSLEHITDEITLNGRIFFIEVKYLQEREETVCVFHDITDFKKLEKIKSDFIANISHELRTPLTAIKGFVETIEDEEEIKNKNYLTVVKRHTERLINIVNDLLILSELEGKTDVLSVEEVNLKEIIENILKTFEQKARERGLVIERHIEGINYTIKADPFRLEQMFINLIDNAIKYTEKGKITISLSFSQNQVEIVVEDTGIGIPKEHIGRIFERFYVVDRSRTKKLGGTGLGLSIVKHIVHLHNGTINVESNTGVGTRITICLPVG
ncbi:MAG: ATP-binding protein [Syntrophorhabdaceae bacterium]|nr:ATP-binding protein [Syntrophorhabdaceae bacterium]